MAKILLIESATDVCGAAISVDGKVVAVVENQQTTSHAALLTLQIQQCSEIAGIKLSDLDAIAMGAGPGSYTSLRVGVSVAKGLCYALEKKFLAVDSMLALALAARKTVDLPENQPVFHIPMIDARRQEICFKIFDKKMQALGSPETLVISNNMFFENIVKFFLEGDGGKLIFSGNGAKKMKNVFSAQKTVFSNIEQNAAVFLAEIAEEMFQASDFQNYSHFEPIYMKPPNITLPKLTHF